MAIISYFCLRIGKTHLIMKRIIAPSVLSADFGQLRHDIEMIDRSAAEWVHIDVMDGVFVPNISFGFPVMKPIRRATSKVLDVHLMITDPERYTARFVEAGADIVTFHYEATMDIRGCIASIRGSGACNERRAGLRRAVVHAGGRRQGAHAR